MKLMSGMVRFARQERPIDGDITIDIEVFSLC